MSWLRQKMDERSVERVLGRLWRGLPAPSEDELQALARSARAESGNARTPAPARASERRPRLRWTLLAVAAALLVGSGLGFGVGSVTPSGNAGGNFVGFGFLPAHGWDVMQSGALDDSGRARAIATNIRLEPEDDLLGAPKATLRSLPSYSVVLFVTFSLRGDPVADSRHPVRELPLRFEDAEELYPYYSLGRYRLRAGVGGYNVDVRIYFGEYAPSSQALVVAQSQLDRLVVAADRVTLRVRPTVVSSGTRVTLFGSIDSAKAGEHVEIQAKDCGLDFFRAVDGAETEAGGGWSRFYWPPGPTTTLRAVWGGASSAEVTVQKRANVHLQRRSARRFEVRVSGKRVWRKRVLFQRFERRLGAWRALKSAVLMDFLGTAHGGESVASATVTLALPKGTLVRAVFPEPETGPCYLAGTSNRLTT